ncbi:hypothetical protein [Streptomyces sudanensis]|uniref:hypothetical protein n=1 Tax=Streptomyces sudanensis TaxID=436397 RepID=UPI0020CD2902|nr:hypothetical protein [Streptomyces sudanensis]MCP9958819.1 hypothetical protein [Streptomyces sudanensis]MCQ0000700.1 hypothetical protein [Streptomyces sudanensis]
MLRIRVAGFLVLVALAASCDTEPESVPTAASKNPCAVDEGSGGEKLLQAVLRSERFKSQYATTEQLAQRLGQDLRKMKPGSSSGVRQMCHYLPDPPQEVRRLTIELDWTSPGLADRSGVPPEDYTHYTVNGVHAETTDIIAKFRVVCRLPGDLAEPSRRAQLRFTLGNTVNMGSEDPEAQKRHVAFLYLMAQRATEALGCENKPLQGAPVVKPGKG